MTELSRETRIAIIEAKIARYEQSAYDAELGARVAERLDDDRMRQAAAESLKRIEKAPDRFENYFIEKVVLAFN